MRLATQDDRIHGAGAEIVAISVDDEVRQAGMTRRWGLQSIRFVADPGGERFLRPLDLFDPDERGGIGLPALLVVDPAGSERYRYTGRDFADRTHDEDVLTAVDALGLAPIEAPRWEPTVEVPDSLTGYFRTDDILPYFRGNYFGALAIGWRLTDPESRELAKEHRAMSRTMLDALEAWAPNIPQT